jgi:mRNA interferase RelE/StbE
MSYEVAYEIRFLDLAAGFMKDDPAGVAALFDTVDQLSNDPHPDSSFRYGPTGVRRLHADRYRVMYRIDEETKTVYIDHLARLS